MHQQQKQSIFQEMGAAKTEHCNRIIRSFTRRHLKGPQFLLSGIRVLIRLTKAKDDFYLMNSVTDTKQKLLLNFSTPN
jgi:hypothetical protein